MLTNSQSNEIERIYAERRRLAAEKQITRNNELREKFPVIAEIDAKIVENSLKAGRAAIMNNDEDALRELKELNAQLTANKEAFLEEMGISRNYLTDVYYCNKCKDTGIYKDKRCKCYFRTIIDTFYMDDAKRELFARENFNSFNENLYSEEKIVEGKDITERELVLENLDALLNYVDDFDKVYQNVFISGHVGTGKSFLANSIAGNLMDKGKTVLYLSAVELKQLFSDANFSDWEDRQAARDRKDILYDVDCLIIDDLGTEVVNNLMQSELFDLIEKRGRARRSVVITSNFNIEGIKRVYSDRISSRIENNYLCLYMPGDDNRGKKM